MSASHHNPVIAWSETDGSGWPMLLKKSGAANYARFMSAHVDDVKAK